MPFKLILLAQLKYYDIKSKIFVLKFSFMPKYSLLFERSDMKLLKSSIKLHVLKFCSFVLPRYKMYIRYSICHRVQLNVIWLRHFFTRKVKVKEGFNKRPIGHIAHMSAKCEKFTERQTDGRQKKCDEKSSLDLLAQVG